MIIILFHQMKMISCLSHERSDFLKENLSIAQKNSLSISEASTYFGIGEKRLRSIINENIGADYILEIGTHVRIKREKFEQYLNNITTV